MNPLVLKDLLNLRRTLKTILLMLALFGIIFIPMGNAMALYFMLMIFAALFPMTTRAYDDAAKWDRYALTMPLSRNDIVRGKYQLMLILIAAALAVSLILMLAVNAAMPDSAQPVWLLIIVGSLGIGYGAVMLPALYKFGTEIARYIMIFGMLVVGVLIVGWFVLFGETAAAASGVWLWIMPPAAALIMLAVSYQLSVRIYAKKEL